MEQNMKKLMESQSQKEIFTILAAQEKKMNLLQGQINEVECKLEEIEKKMNNLAKDFDMTKQEFEEKFKLNDKKIEEMSKNFKSGVELINSEFKEDEADLKKYAMKFYFTLNDYIQAYKISNTGIDKKNNQSTVQKFFGFLSNASIIGSASDLIEKVVSAYMGDIPFEEKADAISKVANQAESSLNKDLSKIIALTVICNY